MVCSAIEAQFQPARLQNLRDCGFSIERVIATHNVDIYTSPKAAALERLRPIAFVDDYLPYLHGVPRGIHFSLVTREPNGSPNAGAELVLAHSQHDDLATCAD